MFTPLITHDSDGTALAAPVDAARRNGATYKTRTIDDLRIKDDCLRAAIEGTGHLLFDGGMGTMLQAAGMKAGALPELLNFEEPQVITDIQRQYVEAGCDVITANTFGANAHKLDGAATVADVFAAAVTCAREAGAEAVMLPIVKDTFEALRDAVAAAAREYDFVVTTGGAANGDFDFIKPVVAELGELMMTTVNIRPGKAQTFGMVEGTPVFGLPGNPAAAYVGFQLLIRPALRTMQGYRFMDHPVVKARLTADEKNRDPRRIYLRANLTRTAEGYEVTPAKNQSSGLFGPIQKTNCLAVMPEGTEPQPAGSIVDCLLLDISEEVVL